MTILLLPAILTAALFVPVAIDVARGNRAVQLLGAVPPGPPPEPPRVSIIVAARNEERNIREALQSLLALDYPDMELIVVDDRSGDGTGAILDRAAGETIRLRVIHVAELPAGWLGKNHALWLGSCRATGELLLFTDADVVMEPSALSRAVRLLLENRLDHLAVTPRLTMPGTFLSMFGLAFVFFFSIFARPWQARAPESNCHIGIGAFNLVRAEAYRAVGGHGRIPLRPDDDLMLGKVLKKEGFRSEAAYGADFLRVEWYGSVGEAVRGLEKNVFAGCGYRVSVALGGALCLLLGFVLPYAAIIVTTGATRLTYLALIIAQILLVADCARFHRASGWHAVGLAPGTLLLSWIIVRATVLNLVQGGITWRGTFYPLKELRKNKV